MDRETAERLGLPYDPALDDTVDDESAQLDGSDYDAEEEASGLSYIPARVRREYEQSLKAYEGSYNNQINQIQKARDLLLSQPTEMSRRDYLQQLGSVLTAPRKSTDPRFYERQNLYTFLRDVGELGSAKKAAEEKAKLEQQQKLLQLDELSAKYGQERDYNRLKLATELMGKYKPTAAGKDDEIIRLQKYRDTLDITDPRRREITERINYLTRGKPEAPKAAEPSAGIKAIDKVVAEDYGKWMMGGASAASSRITKLNNAIADLSTRTDISGPVEGFIVENMPTAASAFYPEAQNVKDVIESVVQEDLRSILGGQFAQLEAKELIKRAYNPRLSEKQNLARVQLLLAQIKNVTNLRQNLFDYFADNETTRGFDFAKLDPNKLLLTDEDTKKLDAGMSVQDVLAGKPLPKQGESKPADAKPSEQKPGQPKKKYKKKIKVGDRIIEVDVEE
jgi:hypothetical protein